MDKTRVLITGATGLIGQHAVCELLKKDCEIFAVSKNHPNNIPNITWHQIDLLQRTEITKLLERVRPTHLIHLAWITQHNFFWEAPENLDWLASSLNLLRSFIESGGERIVAAGTCVEYDITTRGPYSEFLTPLRPISLYAKSKHAYFSCLDHLCQKTNTSYAWGRVFFPFGFGEDRNRLIPLTIRSLLKNETTSFTHGTQLRDPMDARDVGSAFVQLLFSPVQGAVNISRGEPKSIKDIVTAVAELLGKKDLLKFDVMTPRENDAQELYADIARLKNEVCFSPQIGFHEGITKLIEQIKQDIVEDRT